MARPGTKALTLSGLGALLLGWSLLQASVPDKPLLDQSAAPLVDVALLDFEHSQLRVIGRADLPTPRHIHSSARSVVSVVRATVNRDGSLGEILGVESIGPSVDLNDWNLRLADAVRDWQFQPADDDGRPVEASFSLRVHVPAETQEI